MQVMLAIYEALQMCWGMNSRRALQMIWVNVGMHSSSTVFMVTFIVAVAVGAIAVVAAYTVNTRAVYNPRPIEHARD